MRAIHYREIEGSGGFWALVGLLALLLAAGLTAAYFMEHIGHIITGMTNQVVWGMPHVFAVFLIVAASGALNTASIASVFGRVAYKPLARLSGLLAIALLIGGLAILVLDLGRPDRLGVAMTHYNFRSIFAWNIFLYTGFIAVTGCYLWVMMERRLNRHSRTVGTVAFLWRLILTTGTGSIFGLLMARKPYDEAIMAPMFIVMSLAFGLAIFILVLMAACRAGARPLGEATLMRLKNLLGVFAAGLLYFLLVFHLTKLYEAKFFGAEAFILWSGGPYMCFSGSGWCSWGGCCRCCFSGCRRRAARAPRSAGARPRSWWADWPSCTTSSLAGRPGRFRSFPACRSRVPSTTAWWASTPRACLSARSVLAAARLPCSSRSSV